MLPALPPGDPLELYACFDDTLPDHGKHKQRWFVQDNDEDLMRGDGEEVDDPYYNITPVPLTSVASVLHPSDLSRAYVFCGNRYVTIKVIPGTMGDTTERGSKAIIDDWPSLLRTKFLGRVDAVLPSPNNNRLMYFFSAENYALIYADPGTPNDRIIDGPKNIIAEWPSLKSAGFKTIDAVLPNPLNSEQAYIFRGDQYALIHIQQGPNKDYIVDGPKPMWPCLKNAGFTKFTMMLPNPSKSNEVFVFSGKKYVLLSIERDLSDNYIVDGPKTIHTEWPSLRLAYFF